MRVVFTEAADADLVTIIGYIAVRHRAAASDLAMLLDARFKILADYPLLGRDRSNLMPGLRSIVAQNYIIFYRVRRDAVVITRVLHGRQDVDQEFFY